MTFTSRTSSYATEYGEGEKAYTFTLDDVDIVKLAKALLGVEDKDSGLAAAQKFLEEGTPIAADYTANVLYEGALIPLSGKLSFITTGTLDSLSDELKSAVEVITVADVSVFDGWNITVTFDDDVDPTDVCNAALGLVDALKEMVGTGSTLTIGEGENAYTFTLDDVDIVKLAKALLGVEDKDSGLAAAQKFLEEGTPIAADYTANVLYEGALIPLSGKLSFITTGTLDSLSDELKSAVEVITVADVSVFDGWNITVTFDDDVDPTDVCNAALGLVDALKEMVGTGSTLTIGEGENAYTFTLDDVDIVKLAKALLGVEDKDSGLAAAQKFLEEGTPIAADYTANVLYEGALIPLSGKLSFITTGTLDSLSDELKSAVEVITVADVSVFDGWNITVTFDDDVDPTDVCNAALGLVDALKEMVGTGSTLTIGEGENAYTFTLDDVDIVKLAKALLGVEDKDSGLAAAQKFLEEGTPIAADYTANVLYEGASIPLSGKLSFMVEYDITFDINGGDEGTVTEIKKNFGETVTVPAYGFTKEGYAQTGWNTKADGSGDSYEADDTFPMPAGGETLYAVWTIQEYTVTFGDGITVMDGETEIASGDLVAYDTVLTVTADPKTGYTSELSATVGTIEDGSYTVTGAVEFTVEHTAIVYTITWIVDGVESDKTLVNFGDKVVLPDAPTKEGHIFSGWFASIEYVIEVNTETEPTDDATYYAKMDPIIYTITWIVDGVETTTDVAYGTVPAYEGDTPTKAATEEFTFEFSGWTPDLVAVTGDTEYVAVFTSTVNEYTITWNIEGVATTTSVAYGTVPAYGGDTPTKAATLEFTYTFDKWTPALENVTEPATYTAVFKITEVKTSEVEMTADGAESEVDNSVFENLAGDTLTIEVVGEDNVPLYSWKFEGEYKANSMETFTASITESAIGDIEDLLSSVKAENALVLNFAASGELPMNATVRYYVDADKYEDGKVLTLFFYNEVTGELEEVGGDLTVTGGYVEFTLSHLSIYVLAESIATPAQDESAGNTMIYIAVGAAILAIIIASVILRRQ